MKRILAFFLTVCLLTACSTPQASPTTETTLAQPPLLGLCIRDRDRDPAYYDALEQLLRDAGYRLSVADSQNDQSRQDSLIAGMVQEGCALILSEPVMVSAQETVLHTTAQLPLLLLNYQPEAAVLESRQNLAYIGCDPAEAAILQSQAAALLPDGGDLNGDGLISYAILTGPEDHLDAQLHIKGAQWETGELLATEYTDWTSQQGQAACSRLLSQYGLDLEVILCGNPALAQGALQAVEDRGWRAGQDGYLLALGSNDEIPSLILQGGIASTVIPDTQAQLDRILQTAEQMLAGIQPETVTYTPYITVTADNATEYLP
ncbi:MAG: hypothetical protein E7437_00405 [Ruminococcaceae bacterium]|nr:hypothetical protein [Oscillospiraceae bacterium]